jgi:hypothetical protein
MHRLFVPEPSEKATQFQPAPAGGAFCENTPNGVGILQHSCSIYVAAGDRLARFTNDSTQIITLFQILENQAVWPRDSSMLQPGCSITAALGFDGKT